MDLRTTHYEYKLGAELMQDVIDACRSTLGDNDIFQPYAQRPWITFYNCVNIRKDLIKQSPGILTFLLLKV